MIDLLPSTSLIFAYSINHFIEDLGVLTVHEYIFVLGHLTSISIFLFGPFSFPKCAIIEKAIWSESNEPFKWIYCQFCVYTQMRFPRLENCFACRLMIVLVRFSLGGWQVDNYSAKLCFWIANSQGNNRRIFVLGI